MVLSSQEEQNQQESIKLISECYVKPKALDESTIRNPYYLAPADLLFLSINPIQKGLLFHLNPKPQISSFVHKLKLSLSHALVHFYPLAGRFETIKYPDEHACLVYLECTKGPGARLIHAVDSHLSVDHILSAHDVPSAVGSFFDLGQKSVNHDGHDLPLLSVQVTEILDGVFIGFTMNHSLVDGTTFSHFINSLSEIFTSFNNNDDDDEINIIPISRVPIVKPFIIDGYDPKFKLPYIEPEEFVTRYEPDPFRERIFHFSSASIAALKAKANQEFENEEDQNGAHQISLSSFQALSGLVWRSMTRARNPARDERTGCTLLVNARARLEPPLCNEYFGNYIYGVTGNCTVEELLGRSLGWVAMHLHEKIAACDCEMVQGLCKYFVDHAFVTQPGLDQEDIYGPNKVVIGGSARFNMYGPEFGLGRAVAVRTGFANKDDGKVTANPGCEGGGSVDLEICLKPETMAALEVDEEFMNYVSL